MTKKNTDNMKETDNNVMKYSGLWGWVSIIYWFFQGRKKREGWVQAV